MTNKQLRSLSTFITQYFRDCAQALANALENSRKYQKWLRETSQAKVQINPKDLERYSLDPSKVKWCWSKLKHFLHSKVTYTYEALDQGMTEALDYIRQKNTIGWFKHCDLFT